MLSFLPSDMLLDIVTFLSPFDFKQLYHGVKNTEIQHLLHRCTIQCKEFVSEGIIQWFKQKKIPLILLQEIIKKYGLIRYLKNGQPHRDDDLPAFVYITFFNGIELGETQIWYQNGKCHRDHGRPSYVHFNFNENRISLEWCEYEVYKKRVVCSQSLADAYHVQRYHW